MSFGFWTEEAAISQAIVDSIAGKKEKIIFMAAASNSGGNSDVMWPAKHDAVFDIRATDHKGVFKGFNPPADVGGEDVYGTLGVNVEGAWPSADTGYKVDSGTSFATPVAAGIASLILDAARFSLHVDGEDVQGHEFEVLWKRRGLRLVLRNMSMLTGHNARYLNPKVFCRNGGKDRSEWLRQIVKDRNKYAY